MTRNSVGLVTNMEHPPHQLRDSSEEDHDLGDMIATLIAQGDIPGFSQLDGSVPSKKPHKEQMANKDRNFALAKQRFDRYYLRTTKSTSESDFERRFRMPRTLFSKIEQALYRKGEFKHMEDAARMSGIHPRIKIIAALRVLAYGMSFDKVHEPCELSES